MSTEPGNGRRVLALFVALTGGAVAAGIVPVAKHAFVADVAKNAKKLRRQDAGCSWRRR